jgi:hypothetical protein
MIEPIENTWAWIREDWKQNPLRFCVEVLCWLDSLVCAIIVNTTVPNLPFTLLYPLWISGTLAYAWCAWSRGSFGMLATFLMIASMDTVGWMKVLWPR